SDVSNARQLAVEMRCRFSVDRETAGTSPHEVVEILLRLDDHEMNVERKRGAPAHGVDERRCVRTVGHETAVHHVDVNPVGATGLAHCNLVAKLCKVRAENGRDDPDGHGAFAEFVLTVRVTVVPSGSFSPGRGCCASTVPGGVASRYSSSPRDALKPTAARRLDASSNNRPPTFGTFASPGITPDGKFRKATMRYARRKPPMIVTAYGSDRRRDVRKLIPRLGAGAPRTRHPFHAVAAG